MIQRGRKSASSLAVVTPIQDHRPPAPDDMPDVQQELWHQIVGRMPHDWFRKEHLELLRAYCQRVCVARQLAKEIERFQPDWLREDGGLERFDMLTRLVDREHRAMTMLARSMRITHQAQLDRAVAGPRARDASGVRLPWDMHK